MAKKSTTIDWNRIRLDYNDGFPIDIIAVRNNVPEQTVRTHIEAENWSRPNYLVALDITEKEREKWKAYLEQLGDYESRYNLQRLATLIQSEPLINKAETVLLKQITNYIDRISFLGPSDAILALKTLSGIVTSIRRNRNETLSNLGLVTGDGSGLAPPLQIVYNTTPPDGQAANGHESS